MENWIFESIQLLGEDFKTISDKFIEKRKKDISDRLQDKLSTDERLRNKADELGIKSDYNPKEYMQHREAAYENPNSPSLEVNKNTTENVKNVILILRNYVSPNTGKFFQEELRKACENGTVSIPYNTVLRIKDFIDSQDLRFTYDFTVDARNKTYLKFGIEVDKETGEINLDNFDLNNITKNHLDAWYNDDRKNKFTKGEGYLQIKKTLVDKYLMSEYGVEMKIPSFSSGNAKVKNALIINFTSAFRCPAWNECLVKHACYARSGEGRYYSNSKIGNDRKNLMWEAAKGDKEFMNMLYSLLKAYVIDYTKVSKGLQKTLSLVRKNNTDFISKLGNIDKINTLIEMDFSEMPEEVLNLIKENVRVNEIRLNENGDFIGQWLLDEFDRIAGDFSKVGITTASYACRNLNYKDIKNIVINASRIGMEGKSIARYFYALPTAMYDAFEDTYANTNVEDKFNAIQRVIKPLYSVDSNGNKYPNGNYYYKCPCGREDFNKMNKKGGLTKLEKVNCYQCHLCYERPDEDIINKLNGNGKFIVFVKAHGSMANLLDKNREIEIIKTVGVAKNYELGLTDDGSKYANDIRKLEFDSDYGNENVEESVEPQVNTLHSDEEAFNVITDNAIGSMKEHLPNYFNSQLNIQEQKDKFNETYNRFFKD